jgi:hypothetical protein
VCGLLLDSLRLRFAQLPRKAWSRTLTWLASPQREPGYLRVISIFREKVCADARASDSCQVLLLGSLVTTNVGSERRYNSARRRDWRAVGSDKRGVTPALEVKGKGDRRLCPKGGFHEPALCVIRVRSYRTRNRKGEAVIAHHEYREWRCDKCHSWKIDPKLIPFSGMLCSSTQLSHYLEKKWCGEGHLYDVWDIESYYNYRWVRRRDRWRGEAAEEVVACVMCGRAKRGPARYGVTDKVLLRASGIGEAGVQRIVMRGSARGWSSDLGRAWTEKLEDPEGKGRNKT